jgi:acetylglutamate kinase
VCPVLAPLAASAQGDTYNVHAATFAGAMIPKVETCIYALETGVEGVIILDGKIPHAVLLELLTDHGAGTLMMR